MAIVSIECVWTIRICQEEVRSAICVEIEKRGAGLNRVGTQMTLVSEVDACLACSLFEGGQLGWSARDAGDNSRRTGGDRQPEHSN